VPDSSDVNARPLPGPEVPGSVAASNSGHQTQGEFGDPSAQVWSILAPLLAGRPRVRESRGRSHQYLHRWERPLTDRLPAVPAAVPIYSGAGDTRVLVIDLDSGKAGPEAVRRDAAAIRDLLRAAGGEAISDESPSGGWHLYVPLSESIGFRDARDLALALAARTPTMDPSPNQNLTDGLIRPPGSVHPSGGRQVLHGPLAAAHRLASTGNPREVLDRLRVLLATELADVANRFAAQEQVQPLPGDVAEIGYLPRRSGERELAADYLRIAVTGVYDTAKYASPSEARQAVLDAAVWAGLTFEAVVTRVEKGIWPGFSSFYARYRHTGTRRKAMVADWQKAIAYVTRQQARNRTESLVRISPTSEPPSHGGRPSATNQDQLLRGTAAEYQWIRTWRNALMLLELDRYGDRSGQGKRWVLRAMGEAASKSGSRYIAFGVRSLSIATGMDHTTVAKHLRDLRDEPDPLIDLIEGDRGLQGDLYQLRIPDEVAVRASRISWPASKIRALRPAFRELGQPAAFVFEALEHAKAQPQRSFDLTGTTGLSRSAVHEALLTLASWNLVESRAGRWTIVAGTSLAMLAEQFGCLDAVRTQIHYHRQERVAYRRALRVVDQHLVTGIDLTGIGKNHEGKPDDDYLLPPEPPPDEETLLELLHRELGAYLIDVS